MARKGKDSSMDELVLLAGLGIVGYMAYLEYFPGKSLDDVMATIDSAIAGVFQSLPKSLDLSGILPPLPTPPQPIAEIPSVTREPLIQNIELPPEIALKVPDPETGQVPYNPTTPTSVMGRGTEGNYSVIAAAGDFDNNSKTAATMASMEKQGIQAILGLGDYSYSGSPESWASSVLGPRWTGRMKGAQGNHDNTAYIKIFNQSGYNIAYKYGPHLACVFINTESGIDAGTLDSLTTQAKAMATNVCYAFHKPYVTSSDAHHPGSENKSGSTIEAAARKHGIKLILAGHNHDYEHSTTGGIHYVTSGAAGRKFYPTGCKIPGAVKCIENTNGFLKINAGARLLCQFISNQGQILDTFTV